MRWQLQTDMLIFRDPPSQKLQVTMCLIISVGGRLQKESPALYRAGDILYVFLTASTASENPGSSLEDAIANLASIILPPVWLCIYLLAYFFISLNIF